MTSVLWKDTVNQQRIGGVLTIVASPAIVGSAPWALAQPAQPLPIRIGFTRVGSLAPIMIAVKKGLYREAGLETSAITGASGPENLQALLGGSVDVAIAVAGPIARALDQGAPLVGIARFATGGDRYAVVAGAQSGIASLDDLRGKRIGYTFGTPYEMTIKSILRERRLSDRDITPVNLRILDAPDLKIVCSHAGWPFVTEMIAVAFRHDNVFVENFIYQDFPGMQPWIQAYDTILSSKILFASGFPFRDYREVLRWFDRLPLSDQSRDRILHENAARLLGIAET